MHQNRTWRELRGFIHLWCFIHAEGWKKASCSELSKPMFVITWPGESSSWFNPIAHRWVPVRGVCFWGPELRWGCFPSPAGPTGLSDPGSDGASADVCLCAVFFSVTSSELSEHRHGVVTLTHASLKIEPHIDADHSSRCVPSSVFIFRFLLPCGLL